MECGSVSSCIDSGVGGNAWLNGSSGVLKLTFAFSVDIGVELRGGVVRITDAFDNFTFLRLGPSDEDASSSAS